MATHSTYVPKNPLPAPAVVPVISNYLETAEMEHVRFFDLFNNVFFLNNPDKRTLAAKRYSVLLQCRQLTESKAFKIIEVFEAYKKTLTAKLKTYEAFTRKLKALVKNGVSTCTHGRIGNLYESKIGTWTIAAIHEYLNNPCQLSYAQVKVLVNKSIEDFNKIHGFKYKPISRGTVAQYYIKHRNELNYKRQGKQPFDAATRSYLPRIKALNAGSLVQMDGSPIQIFCWNHPDKWAKEGKRKIRPNLFVLRDTYSGKITGFDISENEDRYNIIASIKMMVQNGGHLPAELVHDNSSASKTDEFKAIREKLENRGVKVRAAKVGNAQDKGEVERFFGTFQSRFQRLIDGYIGEGIRSKRANGRIAEEHLNKHYKENGVYGYDQMNKIIAELITIYNNSPINEKYGDKTPNQLYAESEKAHVKSVNPLEFSQMFWLNKDVTVNKSMIINEVHKSKRYYEIWDNELKLKLNSQKVRIYYEEDDASEINIFSTAGEFLCTCKQRAQIHEAFVDQKEGEQLQMIKHVAHRDTLYSHIESKATQRILAAEKETGEPFDLVTPITRAKEVINNAESQFHINNFLDSKGFDRDKIADREPVNLSSPGLEAHGQKGAADTKRSRRTSKATYAIISTA